jgi:CRP-like cAMP-binding protein
VRQHAKGEYLFIVQEGQLDMYCEVDQKYHGIVKEGQVFGELALLWGKEFAVSIIAKVPATVVWRLEQSIFRHVVARHAREQDANIVNNLRKVAIFQQLQDSILQKFAGNLTRVHFREGETIYRKGEIGETFYIIESGSARVHDIGIGDSRSSEYTLHDGDSFGELSLLTGEPRAASITAITNVSTLAMDRDTFQENVGDLQELVQTQARKQCLKGLPIFANAHLTEIEFDRLAESMQELSYKKGTKLAQIGQLYPKKVWFVLKGQIIVFGNKSGQIYNLMAGDYFGEKSILSAPDHVSSHEAICEDNLDAWVLSSDDIESIVVKMDRLGHVGDYVKSKQQKSDVSGLADLTKRRVLGQGGFGKVWLVESKASGKPFALKEISKLKLLEFKQERSVLREKELLGLLHHPFILDLVSSFQDASNLYLVLPLVQGGELFSLVASKSRNGHGIPNNDAAFYAAGIVAALGHFHHRLIAYRDMKLENVMIDSQGYPKIVDLGFARIIVEKSYTFCGTPE